LSKLFKTKVRKGNNFQNLLLQPPPCQTFRLNSSSISQADIIKSLTMSKFIPHSRSSPSPPSNQLSSHHPQSPLQNIQSQAQPPPHHHFLPNYTPFQHFRTGHNQNSSKPHHPLHLQQEPLQTVCTISYSHFSSGTISQPLQPQDSHVSGSTSVLSHAGQSRRAKSSYQTLQDLDNTYIETLSPQVQLTFRLEITDVTIQQTFLTETIDTSLNATVTLDQKFNSINCEIKPIWPPDNKAEKVKVHFMKQFRSHKSKLDLY
jgi:hypothetical protein